MISLLLGLVALVFRLLNLVLLVYCVMSFVMPGSEPMRKAARYVEPVLRPFRELLYRLFPKLAYTPVDFSPLAVWVVLNVALWLLNLLQRLL